MTSPPDNEDRRIEADIIRTLKGIGFPESPEQWRESPAIIDPQEQTLKILGHPVMSGWEHPYMQKLAEIATSQARTGRVLELGFGLGISASYIQRNPPAEHVIIDMNREICEQARQFADAQSAKVTILEGFWQDVVPTLPSESFHGILFDTYPLSEHEVDVIFYPFLEHAYRLLAPGGVLTYYSDEATWFSDEHIAGLNAAGFHQIDGIRVPVTPPEGCEYWRQNTILAPIVTK